MYIFIQNNKIKIIIQERKVIEMIMLMKQKATKEEQQQQNYDKVVVWFMFQMN